MLSHNIGAHPHSKKWRLKQKGLNFVIRTHKILETISLKLGSQEELCATKEKRNEALNIRLPDFLHEDGFQLASEVLRSDFALEILACQHALLWILDVVPLLALYQPFDSARLHLTLHPRQRLLQVPVEYLHSDPSQLLNMMTLALIPTQWV